MNQELARLLETLLPVIITAGAYTLSFGVVSYLAKLRRAKISE